ncbi:methyltransferase, FxLD system [Streptacidiphilus neutrinimicus]|uniref:methyltransferase, FxLD system n=1 Tax=Streptacidiphilus neutrinimicus TaxID=105420 RepID=UPI0005A5DB85|nr:methyltransferase, FxLD system [Streptacidiphilus neutrinimicus]
MTWQQHNVHFPDRDTAIQTLTHDLGPALTAAEATGLLNGWWFMRKQPLHIRYQAPAPVPAVTELLDTAVGEGRALWWANAIYEPETLAFGGDQAMDAAHALFHADSHHLLTYDAAQLGHLGRRETALLLCSALMRGAGRDRFEQGDIWAKVSELRPLAPVMPSSQHHRLLDAVHTLITADPHALARPGKALDGQDQWVHAFEHTGRVLADLAHQGRLTRGLRAVLAHLTIFHANRAGLSLESQSAMSALAREAVMGTVTTPPATNEAAQLRNSLVDQLTTSGHVRTSRVEQAMRTVPRHLFVPDTPLRDAYANTTVNIKTDDTGASISCASQPSVVALMLEQLDVHPGHRILELGAGTGYNAALLAHIARDGRVITLDVDDDLVDGARAHLRAAGAENVEVVLRDGALGYAETIPYERIVATVGAHGIPSAWLDQLAPGGRLVVPQRLRGSVSRSIAWEHHDGRWLSVGSEMNTFMPLRRGVADDVRRMIPLSSDGTVRLQTSAHDQADPHALADVLHTPRAVTWSDVTFAAMESPEWMELWLTLNLPSGANRLVFASDAVGSLLPEGTYPSSGTFFDKGALAFLVRRPSDRVSPQGGRLWEFGIASHGPGGTELAHKIADELRIWDHDWRHTTATFELKPLHAPAAPDAPGRFSFSTTLNRIDVTWR